MTQKVGALVEPDKPDNVPASAQWLSGQGGGVWFDIQRDNNQYRIQRYAPSGTVDCDALFRQEDNQQSFDINEPYRFEHISHCAKCRISQGDTVFVFNVIDSENQ